MTRVICLCALLLVPSIANAEPDSPASTKAALNELFVLDGESVSLDVPADLPERVEIGITRKGRLVTLDLVKHSLRSPDLEVLVEDQRGQLNPIVLPPVATYRGSVRGVDGTEARASLAGGQLRVYVSDPNGGWVVQPLTDVLPNADTNEHLVYDDADVRGPEELGCGVPDDPEAHDQHLDPAPNTLRGTTGRRTVEIALDVDREFYNINGSSTTNVVNDLESLFNGIETLYETNLDLTLELTLIVVRTAEPDPYNSSNAGVLLDEFEAHWDANFRSWAPYDVAHLITGKNLGATIGIAATPSVCKTGFSAPYGLSESRYSGNITLRRSLTAHEIGHNFFALHCNGQADCRIMCSGNGGCGSPTTFGASARSRVAQYAAGRSCLRLEERPIVAPMLDRFTSLQLDLTSWWYAFGSEVRPGGTGLPSAPYALALNAANADDYRDDEIRTGFVNLVGVPNPTLAFFARHIAVDAGERVIAEVYTSSNEWESVQHVVSVGAPMADFVFFSVPLSGDQVHAETRVRFRALMDSTSEFWFIDDVFIGSDPGQPGACCLPAGECAITIEASCIAQGGTFAGEGTTCAQACSPDGVCCIEVPGLAEDCQIISVDDCLTIGGFFAGVSGQCGDCPQTCPCDWNVDGGLNDQDFFDWVNDFFTGTGPIGGADYNDDGNENDQDFFDFVNCFFSPVDAGC